MEGAAINMSNDTNHLAVRSHVEGVRELYHGRKEALATNLLLPAQRRGETAKCFAYYEKTGGIQ